MGTTSTPRQQPTQPTHSSKHYDDPDFAYGTSVATSDPAVRAGFIRKVYSILSLQLALTALLAAALMFLPPLARFAAGNLWLSLGAFAGTIATLVALMIHKDTHPTNMHLLAAFTFFQSISVGTVCAAFKAAGIGIVVLQALILTLTVFAALTVYCFTSKKDFSFLAGFLCTSLWVLLAASLLQMIFGAAGKFSPTLSLLFSAGGAIIFSGYILFDTSMIMHHLSPDEYIQATISLYLDIINLFMHLLRILAELQDRN